jgi:hypothetical protein
MGAVAASAASLAMAASHGAVSALQKLAQPMQAMAGKAAHVLGSPKSGGGGSAAPQTETERCLQEALEEAITKNMLLQRDIDTLGE